MCRLDAPHGRWHQSSVRRGHPPRTAVNREAKDEPPESRGRGPAALPATALWLREWFDDLAFEVHDVVVDGDLVVIHNTMSGRQTGTATIYGEDGGIAQAMPTTGKRYATTQTHWFRFAGRPADRALGQPRRPGNGDATRVGAAHAVVPAANVPGHPPRPPTARRPAPRYQ